MLLVYCLNSWIWEKRFFTIIPDMIKTGIIDPLKVARSVLQNAVSASAMLLTTEVVVADMPEKKEGHMHGGGGMPGGGMGMDY